MAQGNSGSFTLTGSQNFAVIIYWSETYNESANTHVVSITAAQLVSYNWYGSSYTGRKPITNLPIRMW